MRVRDAVTLSRAWMATAFLGAAASLGACGAADAGVAGPTASSAALHSTSAAPQFVYALPPNDQMPSSLAGDPVRGGVWFLTGSTTATALVYLSPISADDHTYSLPAQLSFGFDTAVTVAPDESVWVGARMTVIHLVPSSGLITMYTVPTPVDNPVAESYRPPSVRGTHDIISVSVSTSGTVALALSDANEVTTLSQGIFTAWPLPAGTDPVDVAFLTDGTLGVNLDDYDTHHVDELATFTPSGTRTDSGVLLNEIPRLAASGSAFVSVSQDLTTIGQQAHISSATPLQTSSDVKPVPAAPIAVLPSGNLALPSMNGILFVNVASGQTTDLQLSGGLCGSSTIISGPPGNFTPGPPPAVCPEIPLFVAADGLGDLWLIEPNQTQIALLQGITF